MGIDATQVMATLYLCYLYYYKIPCVCVLRVRTLAPTTTNTYGVEVGGWGEWVAETFYKAVLDISFSFSFLTYPLYRIYSELLCSHFIFLREMTL